MVRRRAIGASVAAAIVFSTLLLGNSALLAAAAQRERFAVTANSESLLADAEAMQAGTEGLGMLDSLQNFLSSQAFECSGADGVVARFVASLSASGGRDGVTVNESAAAITTSSQQDNLTILSPFNGSVPYGVSFEFTMESAGKSADGSALYAKSEVHHLNIPARLGAVESFCESSLTPVRTFLEEQSFPSCNATLIGSALGGIEGALGDQADGEGLTFSIAYKIESSNGCSVEFTNQVAQVRANGPEGPFNLQVQQEESVPVRVDG